MQVEQNHSTNELLEVDVCNCATVVNGRSLLLNLSAKSRNWGPFLGKTKRDYPNKGQEQTNKLMNMEASRSSAFSYSLAWSFPHMLPGTFFNLEKYYVWDMIERSQILQRWSLEHSLWLDQQKQNPIHELQQKWSKPFFHRLEVQFFVVQ